MVTPELIYQAALVTIRSCWTHRFSFILAVKNSRTCCVPSTCGHERGCKESVGNKANHQRNGSVGRFQPRPPYSWKASTTSHEAPHTESTCCLLKKENRPEFRHMKHETPCHPTCGTNNCFGYALLPCLAFRRLVLAGSSASTSVKMLSPHRQTGSRSKGRVP